MIWQKHFHAQKKFNTKCFSLLLRATIFMSTCSDVKCAAQSSNNYYILNFEFSLERMVIISPQGFKYWPIPIYIAYTVSSYRGTTHSIVVPKMPIRCIPDFVNFEPINDQPISIPNFKPRSLHWEQK